MYMQSREERMLAAAQMYYFEGLTHSAIGSRLGCTRWTVSRLLEEARETGLVTITINHPHARVRNLEQSLISKFSLERAIVVHGDADERSVARAAASFLVDLRPAPSTLAVSWGRTMAAVAAELPEDWCPGLQVYQTNGGPQHTGEDTVSQSLGVIAQKAPGTGHILPAPAIIADAQLSQQLRFEPSIANTLELAAKADWLIYSPGSITSDSVMVRSGYLQTEQLTQIKRKQGVAEVLTHYINREGRPISRELELRTLALSLDALAKRQHNILVADRLEKVESIATALRCGYATVAILSAKIATAVLEYH